MKISDHLVLGRVAFRLLLVVFRGEFELKGWCTAYGAIP